MAGALSESAPRPVSVVRVEAELSVENNNNQQQQQQEPGLLPPPAEPNSLERSNAVCNVQQQQPLVRSFTSTEAQTEQLSPSLLGCSGVQHQPSHAEMLSEELRDARRRERRMRRQHRRAIQRANGAAAAAAAAAVVNGACAAGLPPTYPGLMGPSTGAFTTCAGTTTTLQPSSVIVNAGASAAGVSLVGPGPTVGSFLHPPPPHLGLRGLSLGLPFPVPPSVSAFGRDAVPKQCCGLGSPPVRWSILGVGVVGLVCAGAGALLGALRATGRDHIAVALLMIGIGVVLVTVSAVAWRVTSRENCAGFFGLTGISGRIIPPTRPMHPYAAMIYPEFQFRTPPPSYQASMQEYRLRLLLLDRLQPTSSPPPTYRSNAGSCIVGAPSALHQPLNGSLAAAAAAVAAVHHHQSANAAAVAAAAAAAAVTTTTTLSRESRPPSYCGHRLPAAPAGPLANSGQSQQSCSLPAPSKKDANLVRIVQTESEQVILSGDQTPPVTAVEVLAQL